MVVKEDKEGSLLVLSFKAVQVLTAQKENWTLV